MNYPEIIKLLDAGYTREEIMAMNEPEKEPEKEPENEPENNQEENKSDEFTSAIQEMKDIFTGFKNELQAMNIMNSRINNPDVDNEDIIASIINPFDREKEK